MEREPTVKERIELFIQRLLDNGFVEQDEDEVQQYIMFFIGTPWFNAIPLLGTTALGANAYFNNNKNE